MGRVRSGGTRLAGGVRELQGFGSFRDSERLSEIIIKKGPALPDLLR